MTLLRTAGAAVLAAGLAVPWAAGCKRDPPAGASYDCRCELLTDTDGSSTVRVQICAADPRRADQVARGCAQSGAPAQIQSCSCQSQPQAAPCAVGSCQVAEHR